MQGTWFLEVAQHQPGRFWMVYTRRESALLLNIYTPNSYIWSPYTQINKLQVEMIQTKRLLDGVQQLLQILECYDYVSSTWLVNNEKPNMKFHKIINHQVHVLYPVITSFRLHL